MEDRDEWQERVWEIRASIYIYIYIYIYGISNVRVPSWCNDYFYSKWTRLSVFKSWTRKSIFSDVEKIVGQSLLFNLEDNQSWRRKTLN